MAATTQTHNFVTPSEVGPPCNKSKLSHVARIDVHPELQSGESHVDGLGVSKRGPEINLLQDALQGIYLSNDGSDLRFLFFFPSISHKLYMLTTHHYLQREHLEHVICGLSRYKHVMELYSHLLQAGDSLPGVTRRGSVV